MMISYHRRNFKRFNKNFTIKHICINILQAVEKHPNNGRTLFVPTYEQRIYAICRGRRPRRPLGWRPRRPAFVARYSTSILTIDRTTKMCNIRLTIRVYEAYPTSYPPQNNNRRHLRSCYIPCGDSLSARKNHL